MHIVGIYKENKIVFSLNSGQVMFTVMFSNGHLSFDIFYFYK